MTASGFDYVRKEKNRHGNVFYRFRWKPKRAFGPAQLLTQVEYVFTEPYRSDEFRLKHSLLRARVDAIKAGLPDPDEAAVEFRQARSQVEVLSHDKAKPKTFRWLCNLYWKSPEFGTKSKASARTKYQAKRILELCCQEPIQANHPDKEKFADYPLEGPRAMRLSDLEILRDRAATKKKVKTANGRSRTIGGPGAADMRVKHLQRLFSWAVKHREKTHIEHDIAAHLDRIGEDTGGHLTWKTEWLDAYERRHPVGTQARLAFDIFQYTGCRISDAIKIGPRHVHDDVDKSGEPIKVCRFNTTKKKGGAAVGPEVTVGMCQALLDSIAKCNRVGLDAWLVTEDGKPFASPTAFGNKFRDWVRQAGLPIGNLELGIKGATPHGIRKAAACRAAENEATTQQAMAMFGWLTEKEFTRYAMEANRRKLGRAGVTLLAR